MRWIVKTTLDGRVFDDVACDGRPTIPETGAEILIPVDDHYASGVVSEVAVDESQTPAVLRIICLTPDAFAKERGTPVES
jgi:hypothetical protein